MKLKNVKVGETYIIKRLDNTLVGLAPFKIGDKVVAYDLTGASPHTVGVYDGWVISHKDLKRVDVEQSPIPYTHPMQEHLGKEVVVKHNGYRGWVVGHADDEPSDELLVDFGDGFKGHRGRMGASKPYFRDTCGLCYIEDLRFLTEDEE